MTGGGEGLIARLLAVDTPTLCNAIELAEGRRGFAAFTRRGMCLSGPPDRRLVGFARTARIASRQPATDPPEVLRARRLAYFRSMAAGPRPGVAVVEDIDGDAALGAWWGEINALVHARVCGLSGAVTNGLMRDLGDLPADFPILAGGIGPSHGHVHVRETGVPIEVSGLPVAEGDLIHADRHGALVVPAAALAGIEAVLDRLLAAEARLLGPLRGGPVAFADFAALWAEFEQARV